MDHDHGPAATNRDHAAALDAADPLGPFIGQFVVDDPELVYFDGNSLGRLPRRTADALARATREEWGGRLVRGWEAWVELPLAVGDELGTALLGAAPGQTAVCDSTTVNFYKLAAAAFDARPDRRVVVTDAANFPTDRFVLEGLARQRGLELRQVALDPLTGVTADAVAAAVGPEVGLVTFSMVDYRSGALAEVGAVTALAHAAGALTLWDLSHAAGAVPARLDEWGVDLAVGCTYKYVNAGPGAPAWLYVRAEHQGLSSPVWGWFGAADQFAMGPHYTPETGMRRWLAGTPPVLGLVAVREGVALLAEAGIDAIREKGRQLGAYAAALVAGWLAPLGFELASPADPDRRGSQLALRHPEAFRLCRALIEEAAVVPDFRAPDILRLGLAPVTTRYVDVWTGLDRLRELAAREAWRAYDHTPGRVT